MVTSLGMVAPAAAGILVLLGSFPGSNAQGYAIDTRENILTSARTLAYDLMTYYKGNQSGGIPGLLPGPPPAGDYYWWQGGALMGAYIDYWHLTGDASYNQVVTQGMLHQTGPFDDYLPLNWTASMGNDDQCFWALSAMSAAESEFPNPAEGKPQWLALAKNVFETQALRIQGETGCNGGLRWQIPFANLGYDFKNSISNGCFFNLAARLARYTNNATYAQYAEQTWTWLQGVGLIDQKTWQVYDGAHVGSNCTDINRNTFSYVSAILVEGAAFMYNQTSGADAWRERVQNLLGATLSTFFPNNIAYEVACEGLGNCITDMRSFKGFVHRWLSVAAQVAPFTADKILPVLRQSAAAGAKQCTLGKDGRACGFRWSGGGGSSDDTTGAGEQMNVLGAVSSLLITEAKAPVKGSADGGAGPAGNATGPGGSAPTKPSSTTRMSVGIMPLLFGLGVCGWAVLLG